MFIILTVTVVVVIIIIVVIIELELIIIIIKSPIVIKRALSSTLDIKILGLVSQYII